MSNEITLQDLIEHVREQLFKPPTDGKSPVLYVEEIELNLGVTITNDAKAGIKVNIQVFEMGVEGGGQLEQTNSIRVRLTPLLTKEQVIAELNAMGKYSPTDIVKAAAKSDDRPRH